MSYFSKLIKILNTFPEVCDAIAGTKKSRGFKRHHLSMETDSNLYDVMVDFVLDGERNVVFYMFSMNAPDTLITDDDIIEECSKQLITGFMLRKSNTKNSMSIQDFVKHTIVERLSKKYAEDAGVDFIFGEDLLTGDEFNIKDILE